MRQHVLQELVIFNFDISHNISTFVGKLCDMKRIDIEGKVYGKLTVISKHSTTRNGHERFTCKCTCGNTCNILKTHLQQENTTSCGCDRPLGKSHKQWKGVGEISGEFWYSHIVRSASGAKGRKAIDLSVTKEQAWNLFLKQNRKCALSGQILLFPKKYKDKSYTASLDRIDSNLGYSIDNIQWIHKDINIMKNKFHNQYFIHICKQIANNSCEIP